MIYSADSTNPFKGFSVKTELLTLTKRDYIYEASFDINGVGDGEYYLASAWVNNNSPNNPRVLSIHWDVILHFPAQAF